MKTRSFEQRLADAFFSSTNVEDVGDINELDKSGDTRLIRACRNFGYYDEVISHLPIVQSQHLKYVKQLLEKGANPTIKNLQGRNALMELFDKFGVGLIYDCARKKLDKAKLDRLIPGERMRTYSIEGKRVTFREEDAKEIVGDSVSVWTRFDEKREKEFMDEAKQSLRQQKRSNASMVIAELIKAGVDIDELDKEGKSALVIAHERRDDVMVDALLDAGANEFELKILNPKYKYLTDQTDPKNIYCESEWSDFVNAIFEAVGNKDSNKYPWARSNSVDNSVLFFVSTDEELRPYFTDHNRNFISSIEKGYLVEQLNFQSRRMGFKKVGEKDFLEIKPGGLGDVIEYKFNISAENLDSILQLNPRYSGYRNSGPNRGGILKLVKDFSLKPDSIMLWPLHSLDEEGRVFHVMAAGCQTMELPTVQLMRLLPNYESEILPRHKEIGSGFHWIPKEVERGLLVDVSSLPEILKKIFLDNGVKVTERNSPNFNEYPELLQIEDSAKMLGVEIVSMDKNARDFYALYGNIAKEELSHCASLEVKVMTFFEAIKAYLSELEPRESISAESIDNAMQNINSMIEKERERRPSTLVESPEVVSPNFKKGSSCVIL